MRADRRLVAPILCYVLGFALYKPQAIAVVDEGLYVAQAAAFAGGARSVAVTDPVTGVAHAEPASPYPIGTSLLQAPLVYVGGWRAAAWLSVAALAATVLVLGRWLRDAGSDPAFALLFLLYAPTLVLGRIAMSDVPSAGVVAAGLWLLWRLPRGGAVAPLLAGFLAAASTLVRETNALVFAPFILGAVLRRERGAGVLLAGVAAGAAVRIAASAWMYGDPFFVRDAGAGFAIGAAPANALFYVAVLTVLLPGGLIGVAGYRGPRRAELVAAVVLTLGLFTCYRYRAASGTWLQQLILAPRFFIPLVPLMAVAGAEAFPRLLARAWAGLSLGWRRGLPGGVTVATCAAAFAVHPVLSRYGATQVAIVRAIYDSTPAGAALVENGAAAQKYTNPVYGVRTVAFRSDYGVADLPRIVAHNPRTYLVFVDRTDSAWFRADAADNDAYVAAAERQCRLSLGHDRWHGPTLRLRIWRVLGCGRP
jgi:hypothetical protein